MAFCRESLALGGEGEGVEAVAVEVSVLSWPCSSSWPGLKVEGGLATSPRCLATSPRGSASWWRGEVLVLTPEE